MSIDGIIINLAGKKLEHTVSNSLQLQAEETVVAEARNGLSVTTGDLIWPGSYIDTPEAYGAMLSPVVATLWIHRDTPVITRYLTEPINTFVLALSDLG